MDQQDKIGFFKWITNMGLVMFIAFSYFYYGPINVLEQKAIELNNEIETSRIPWLIRKYYGF